MSSEATSSPSAGDETHAPQNAAESSAELTQVFEPLAFSAHHFASPGTPGNGHEILTTPSSGMLFSRRVKRITETQEIQLKATRRRRKLFTRSGVLAGFGLAMVVYPVMGNVVTYANSAESVPGVIVGEAPTTGHAILGDGPSLIPSTLPLPSVADEAAFLATNFGHYVVNSSLPDCLPRLEYVGENGRIPEDQLCKMWDSSVLMRADAALALAQMNEEFTIAFGRSLCISQGYRSYEEQVVTKRNRGYMAATPGKSVHGWGLAFDLCRGDDKGAPKEWLDKNAATFGFENPDWAKYRKFEPWHWEYMPGTRELGVYGSSYWEEDDEAGTREAESTVTHEQPATPSQTTPPPAPAPTTPAPAPAPTTPPPPVETTTPPPADGAAGNAVPGGN